MDGIFGIGPLELILIAVLALIVLGPERLPGVMREIAKYIRQFRKVGSELTQQFSEELKVLDEINPRKIFNDMTDPNLPDPDEAAKPAKPASSPAPKPASSPAKHPPAAASAPAAEPPASATVPPASATVPPASATVPPASATVPEAGNSRSAPDVVTPAAGDTPAPENSILPPPAPISVPIAAASSSNGSDAGDAPASAQVPEDNA